MTRLVGINHVALEVGDVEEALAFYGRLFEFTLRGAQFERERAECESDSSVGSDPQRASSGWVSLMLSSSRSLVGVPHA